MCLLPFLRSAAGGLVSCVLLMLAVALAACSSGPADRPTAKRTAPMPTLAGKETLFGGQIVAEVKVGAMTGFKRAEGERGAGGDAPEGRRRHGGGGGGFGGGMGGGGMGEGRPPRGEGGPGESGEHPRPGGMRRGASGPPVMIHLRFTNTGTEAVELRIADFLSPLGNFVVQPEKLTLAPGASAEVEPMTSALAGELTSGEITLKLQLGTARETKTVPLQVEARPGPESGKSGQSL